MWKLSKGWPQRVITNKFHNVPTKSIRQDHLYNFFSHGYSLIKLERRLLTSSSVSSPWHSSYLFYFVLNLSVIFECLKGTSGWVKHFPYIFSLILPTTLQAVTTSILKTSRKPRPLPRHTRVAAEGELTFTWPRSCSDHWPTLSPIPIKPPQQSSL